MGLWIIFVVMLISLLVYALCKVSGDADEQAERMRRCGMMYNINMYKPEYCDGHYCCKDCDVCPIAERIAEDEDSEE